MAKRDLVGQTFGKLTVVEFAGHTEDQYRTALWRCVCECGRDDKIVRGCNLVYGRTRSCGCNTGAAISEATRLDLTGRRFGRLVAIKRAQKSGTHWKWHCLCDCGVRKEIRGSSLTGGVSSSCGCFAKERSLQKTRTHGLSRTLAYKRAHEHRRAELKKGLDSKWTIFMEHELRQLFDECVICGSVDRLQTDHVYPLSRGPGNAVKLCVSCNNAKRQRLPEQLPIDTRERLLAAAQRFCDHWGAVSHLYGQYGDMAMTKFERRVFDCLTEYFQDDTEIIHQVYEDGASDRVFSARKIAVRRAIRRMSEGGVVKYRKFDNGEYRGGVKAKYITAAEVSRG